MDQGLRYSVVLSLIYRVSCKLSEVQFWETPLRSTAFPSLAFSYFFGVERK